MKRLFCIPAMIVVAFSSVAFGQSSVLSGEAQVSNMPGAYQWLAYSHTAKSGHGAFGFASYQESVTTLSAGYLYGTDIRKGKWYVEGAIGPGIDLAQGATNASLNGWLYLETAVETGKNGVALYVNPYYSKAYGSWMMGYALYSPAKWLAVGLHAQEGNVTGPRIQFTPVQGLSVWAAAGNGATLGGLAFEIGL